MNTYQDAQQTSRVFSGSADFFMYQFKIVPCTLPHSHDWSSCPFVHRNEKARRRNPKHFSYAAIPCPVDRKGTNCPRGDACPYSHNVYEYWLHPDRFRTQMCRDGTQCNRPLCFFAHERSELRQPSPHPDMQARPQQQQDGPEPPGTPMPDGFLQQFQQLGVQQQPRQHMQQQQQALAMHGPSFAPMTQQVQYIPVQAGMMVSMAQASSGAMGAMSYPGLAPCSNAAASMAYGPGMLAAGAPPAAWPVWDPTGQQPQQRQQQQVVMSAAGYSPMLQQPWSQAQPVLGGAGGGTSQLVAQQPQQQQQQQGLLYTSQQQHNGMLIPVQQPTPYPLSMQQQQPPLAIQQQQPQQQMVMVVSGPVDVGLQANLGVQQAVTAAGLALPINQRLATAAGTASPGAPSSYCSPVGSTALDAPALAAAGHLAGASSPAPGLQLQGSGGSGSFAGIKSSLGLMQLPVCSGLDLQQQQQQQQQHPQQQYAYLGLPGDSMASGNGNDHHLPISSNNNTLQALQLVGSTGLVGSPGGITASAAAAAAATAADSHLLLGSWSHTAAGSAGLMVTTAGFDF